MMEVRLQSRELYECVHRISGVEDVEPIIDHENDVLVYRLHIGGGRYLDYHADEWRMMICNVM